MKVKLFKNKVAIKISAIYLIVVIASVITMSYIAVNYSNNAIIAQYDSKINMVVETVESNINMGIKQNQYLINSVLLNTAVNQILASSKPLNHVFEFDRYIEGIIENYTTVDELMIYTDQKHFEGISPYIEVCEDYSGLDGRVNGNYKNIIVNVVYDENNSKSYIELTGSIRDNKYGTYLKEIGVVKVRMDTESLLKDIEPFFLNELKDIYIISSDNYIIFSNIKSLLNTRFDINKFSAYNQQIEIGSDYYKEDNLIFFQKQLNKYNWGLVCVGDLSDISQSTNNIKNFTIFLATIVIILFITITTIFGKSIYNSIKRIESRIKSFGDSDEKENIRNKYGGKDELKEVESKVIETGYMLNDYLEQFRDQVKQQGQFELKYLNSQVNQYLLFNTLSNINWMSIKNELDELSELTISLSDYYRKSLQITDNIIALEQEIQQVKSYIRLYEMIYPNKIYFNIDIQEGIADSCTTKFILQPVIENSIKHGILPQADKGEIVITIKKENSELVIKIKDNGVGFDESSIEKEESTNGVGLKNLDDRIKLVFGKEYGLNIESNKGEGTIVTIHQPYEEYALFATTKE